MGIPNIIEPDFSCITCLHMNRKPHTDVRHCSLAVAMTARYEAEGENEHEESHEASSWWGTIRRRDWAHLAATWKLTSRDTRVEAKEAQTIWVGCVVMSENTPCRCKIEKAQLNYSESAAHAKVNEIQWYNTTKATGTHKGEWTTASQHEKGYGCTQRWIMNYSESTRERPRVHTKVNNELQRVNTRKATGTHKGE